MNRFLLLFELLFFILGSVNVRGQPSRSQEDELRNNILLYRLLEYKHTIKYRYFENDYLKARVHPFSEVLPPSDCVLQLRYRASEFKFPDTSYQILEAYTESNYKCDTFYNLTVFSEYTKDINPAERYLIAVNSNGDIRYLSGKFYKHAIFLDFVKSGAIKEYVQVMLFPYFTDVRVLEIKYSRNRYKCSVMLGHKKRTILIDNSGICKWE